MFQQNNTYPMKNLSREVAAGFESTGWTFGIRGEII